MRLEEGRKTHKLDCALFAFSVELESGVKLGKADKMNKPTAEPIRGRGRLI